MGRTPRRPFGNTYVWEDLRLTSSNETPPNSFPISNVLHLFANTYVTSNGTLPTSFSTSYVRHLSSVLILPSSFSSNLLSRFDISYAPPSSQSNSFWHSVQPTPLLYHLSRPLFLRRCLPHHAIELLDQEQ